MYDWMARYFQWNNQCYPLFQTLWGVPAFNEVGDAARSMAAPAAAEAAELKPFTLNGRVVAGQTVLEARHSAYRRTENLRSKSDAVLKKSRGERRISHEAAGTLVLVHSRSVNSLRRPTGSLTMQPFGPPDVPSDRWDTAWSGSKVLWHSRSVNSKRRPTGSLTMHLRGSEV